MIELDLMGGLIYLAKGLALGITILIVVLFAVLEERKKRRNEFY